VTLLPPLGYFLEEESLKIWIHLLSNLLRVAIQGKWDEKISLFGLDR
jgi:hypothetical protein